MEQYKPIKNCSIYFGDIQIKLNTKQVWELSEFRSEGRYVVHFGHLSMEFNEEEFSAYFTPVRPEINLGDMLTILDVDGNKNRLFVVSPNWAKDVDSGKLWKISDCVIIAIYRFSEDTLVSERIWKLIDDRGLN